MENLIETQLPQSLNENQIGKSSVQLQQPSDNHETASTSDNMSPMQNAQTWGDLSDEEVQVKASILILI